MEELSLDIRECHCSKCGLIMDRDGNAAINVLNAGLKKIFNTFIMGRNHKKIRYKGRVPTDCGEFMPVEELTNTFRQASPIEAGSPVR